jgi:hypothetical protein
LGLAAIVSTNPPPDVAEAPSPHTTPWFHHHLPRPPLPRVNKFNEFYRNSPNFDGFGRHRISKPTILLFTDSKYFKNKKCKKTRMNSKQIGEDIFQKRHHLVC